MENHQKQKIINWVFGLIILFLLILNTGFVLAIFKVKTQAQNLLKQSSIFVEQLQNQPVNIPVNTNVEINDKITVPLNLLVPIKTSVNVPVTLPLLGQTVNVVVPIDTQVPINTSVTVQIKKTFPVNVTVNSSSFNSILQKVLEWLHP